MSEFKFKQFTVNQANASMKVGTDSMVLGSIVDPTSKCAALDIGAGTGVLSLMILQRNPDLKVIACEIDQPSAADCIENFRKSKWSEQLQVVCADFLKYTFIPKFDLIFSNPPYYLTSNTNQDKRKTIARHALDMSPNRFMRRVYDLLSKKGDVWIIIPYKDEPLWSDAASANHLTKSYELIIHGKRGDLPNRIICRYSNYACECNSEELVIRETNGYYSKSYIELTKQYHATEL